MTEPAADPRPRAGLRGSLILAAAWVVARLPEAPLVAAAESVGELWYRVAGTKRAQARANLRRACEGLAAAGTGPPRARRAATDPAALERLVRASFRHAARYYLEVLRAGRVDLDEALERISLERPDEFRRTLQGGPPIIIVGMHYGAIELPTVLLSGLAGHAVTAPMETVTDPGLAHWFRTTRSRVGVNVVPIANARRTLLRALQRGESVGLVADRDMMHNGIPVPFFGHPTPIPAGPALLALETGARIYIGSAMRVEGGRYRGRLVALPEPPPGPKRDRVVAYTAAIARAFEDVLAQGPEQWWGAFHPIWPDLAVGAAGDDARDEARDEPRDETPA